MSETYTTDSAEALAEALCGHVLYADDEDGNNAECSCGVEPNPVVLEREYDLDLWAWHRVHIAQALIASDWMKRHEAEVRAEAWDEGYNDAAWRSFRRTDISIGRADEADPPNPYRAALAEEGDRTECSCAMTEGSQRRCAVHGEDDYREVEA